MLALSIDMQDRNLTNHLQEPVISEMTVSIVSYI